MASIIALWIVLIYLSDKLSDLSFGMTIVTK
jgi:hypothetical protein